MAKNVLTEAPTMPIARRPSVERIDPASGDAAVAVMSCLRFQRSPLVDVDQSRPLRIDRSQSMLAERFEPFTFAPVRVSICQLGNSGTARRQLKRWAVQP